MTKTIGESKIIICSIVRDAAKGLRRNIPIIDSFVDGFQDYRVVVFENNSTDKTKNILKDWMERSNGHVIAVMYDNDASKTIPQAGTVGNVNPFYSRKRIEKMAWLRNQYMVYVDGQHWNADYLMVVDLDVARLDLYAILTSFADGVPAWDAVTAFGYSTSPKLTMRYHDTYALTEYGDENSPQTEKKILALASNYAKLKGTKVWKRVFSAFGGLAIYRFECVKGLRYIALGNDDKSVEVKCEHFSIYKQMTERGFDKVYVNPKMVLKYQDLTIKIIWNSMMRKTIKLLRGGNDMQILLGTY